MTDITPHTPLPPDAAVQFAALLEVGKVAGHLSLDQVVHTLKDVELEPGVMKYIQGACEQAGVTLDDAHDSPVPPEITVTSPTAPAPVEEPPDPINEARQARAAEFAATIGDDVEEEPRRRVRTPHGRERELRRPGAACISRRSARSRCSTPARKCESRPASGGGSDAEETLAELSATDQLDHLDAAERSRLNRLVRDGDRAP